MDNIPKDIHIVLSSSNEFIEHCATTMASILYNISQDYSISFYILSYDISEKNKARLNKLRKIKDCRIEYPKFDESLLDMFDGIHLPLHVTKMTYARILIPDILPNIDKAIFIDSDTVVRKDISELYEIDMKNHSFAMVEDANWVNISKRLWGEDSNSYYFNAGVMLVNAKRLRDTNYLQKIKEQILVNKEKYKICDQDVINDTFQDDILRLSITWNCYHEVIRDRFHCYEPDNLEEFQKTCDDPAIVHYVGPEKPWLASIKHKFSQDYFFYNKLTTFKKFLKLQKYKIYDDKYKALILGEYIVYLNSKENNITKIQLLGQVISFKSIKKLLKLFFRTKKETGVFVAYVLGIPLIKKKDTRDKKYIKILGIPIYYKVDKTIKLLDAQAFLLKQLSITQSKVDQLLAKNEIINKKLSNMKCIIEAQKLHEKTFGPYRNAFEGRDVVLVCTGPTVNNYKMIPDAIHIGVNGAIYLENVNLDYLFIQDYTIHQKNNEKLNTDALNYVGNNCKKFFGIIPDDRLTITHEYVERIPLNFSFSENVSQYILEDISHNKIAYDISREPLGEFSGTPFSVLQFIFYTNPKRLYLVGWDCGAGYAYGKNNAINPANYQIEILKKHFLPFIKVNYPNLEIISINPVGLKGIFKDKFI